MELVKTYKGELNSSRKEALFAIYKTAKAQGATKMTVSDARFFGLDNESSELVIEIISDKFIEIAYMGSRGALWHNVERKGVLKMRKGFYVQENN